MTRLWLIIGFIFFISAPSALAQQSFALARDLSREISTRSEKEGLSPAPEIVVRVTLPGAGVIDVITYMRDTTLYLPLNELFNFLQISLESSVDPGNISGFLYSSRTPFRVDISNHLLQVGEMRYTLSEQDFILGVTDCYLSTRTLQIGFGISAMFDEDQLLVTLYSDRPFPVQLEKERERRSQELRQLRSGELNVDLGLQRQRHVLGGGMMDWNAGYSRTNAGVSQQSLALGLGAELLGGDLTASFNAQSDRAVPWATLPWHWRYTAEEAPFFRQANVGWMSTALGQRYGMRGVSVSNSWIYTRTEYGTDVIDGDAEPGVDLELYRNGRLYDIANADSSGEYSFTVPLRYGANLFEVREYSKTGDVRTRSLRFDVPGGFLPPGELEYQVSGGEFQPRKNSYVGESIFRYGLWKSINVGGGLQYFNGLPDDGVFPAAFLDARLSNGLYFSALHHQGIMTMAKMSLATPRDIRAELTHLRYASHPFFSFSGATSETRASAALPLFFLPIRSSISINGRSLEYSWGSAQNLNSTINAGIGTVNVQLTSYLALTKGQSGYQMRTAESILQLGSPLWRSIYMHGSIAYDHRSQALTAARINVSLQFDQVWNLNLQWGRSIRQNITQFQLDLQLRLPFTRLRGTGTYYYDGWQVVQRASGGLAWDQGADALLFSDRSWVGTSAMSILPFMDANGNSERDEGEALLPMPVLTNVRGARQLPGDDDVTRFVEMEQYAKYEMHVDAGGFADPLLVPRYQDISLTTDPNQFKAVYLPVFAGGEIAGEIRRVSGMDTLSEGGTRVWFRDPAAKQPEASAYSFSDGTYAHFGLHPGSWMVTPDSTQLRRRGLIAEPKERKVTLRGIENGDFLTGIDFLLYESGEIIERPEVRIDTLPRIAVIESDKPIAPPFPVDTSGIRPLPPIVDTTVSPPIAAADTIVKPPIAAADTARPPVAAFVPVALGVTEHLEINLGQAGLDGSTVAYLDRLIQTAKTADRYTITLEGHSDNFGSFTENQQRSQERAQRVLDYLIQKGIPRSRIQSQSFGSRQPLAPNTSAAGRRRNNRADITLRGTLPATQTPRPDPTPQSDAIPDSTVFRPPSVPADKPENVKSAFTLPIDVGQPGLTANNRNTLDQVAESVRGLRQYIIQVEGHSDNFGSFTENQQRSEERAKRAADYLVSRGVPRERLQIQAFGSRQPAASNRTADGRRLNNRAEIRVLSQ
jgi:outer membrane protein OmpA-like peptidoglycan-associated protein